MSDRPESPTFLPGEQLLSVALVVKRLLPMVGSSPVPSVMGRLECTNYCLRFTPDLQSLSGGISSEVLNDSKHVPLLSIGAVYKVSADKTKKKLLTVKKAAKKTVEQILIVTKDLKKIRFDLSMSDKRQANTMVSTIVVYSQPTSFSQLFIHDYAKHAHFVPNNDHTVPMFYSVQDWENELLRLKAVGWHVTTSNHDFSLSLSLPPFFVVPKSITDQNLQYVRTLHNQGRLPVWSWSHPQTGAALLRASGHVSDSEGIPSDAGYLWAISMAKDKQAQVNSKAVLPINLAKVCCSVKDVHNSFSKLRDLVLPENFSEMASSDKKWLSSLESTKWMDLVKSCLSCARQVQQAMCDENQPVLLYEPEGKDITCVISSLAQIMMDSSYRTMIGFETLIQKEWVSIGHPFALRHQMVVTGANSEDVEVFAPVFLLFLDCVFQLTNQFLSSFEFSETYLMCLYDTVISGLYCTFLFNSSREYFDTRRPYGSEQGSHVDNYHDVLPQAWGRWMENLPHDVCERCYNPFNFLFASQAKKSLNDESNTFPISHGRVSNVEAIGSDFFLGGSCGLYSKVIAVKESSQSNDEKGQIDRRARISSWVMNPSSGDMDVVLSPQTFQCKLKFWSGFFFRHIPLSNEPFKEVLKVEDIKSQLVREARQYKDSLKEHELKTWSYRHTLSFDDVPHILSNLPHSYSRQRSDSDSHSQSVPIPEVQIKPDLSPLTHRRESPVKPPRPGKSPIMKAKVQVSSGKSGRILPSLSTDDTVLLTHMTPIENGDQRQQQHASYLLTQKGKMRDASEPKPRMSWVTESEEVDAL
jgi:myotubularin-related protein 10/11/12